MEMQIIFFKEPGTRWFTSRRVTKKKTLFFVRRRPVKTRYPRPILISNFHHNRDAIESCSCFPVTEFRGVSHVRRKKRKTFSQRPDRVGRMQPGEGGSSVLYSLSARRDNTNHLTSSGIVGVSSPTSVAYRVYFSYVIEIDVHRRCGFDGRGLSNYDFFNFF